MARRVSGFIAVFGVILLVVATRAVVSSRAELGHGEEALERDDQEAARIHFRRAARWYTPGNPYSTRALQKLAEMGQRAERRGDVETALSCWRAIRAAILATRSLYVPHRQRLDVANAHIASLMAQMPAPPIDAGRTRAQLEQEHLALLQHVPHPNAGWTVLLLFGFVAWLGGAFLFATRAIDGEDRLVRSEAVRWAALIAVGFVAFAVGLGFA